MAHTACETCKILLDKAGTAISAHARAASRLSEAVRANSEMDLLTLELAVRSTSIAREIAVTRYEAHRDSHKPVVMTAGSSPFE